jgi:hypothetical protein
MTNQNEEFFEYVPPGGKPPAAHVAALAQLHARALDVLRDVARQEQGMFMLFASCDDGVTLVSGGNADLERTILFVGHAVAKMFVFADKLGIDIQVDRLPEGEEPT